MTFKRGRQNFAIAVLTGWLISCAATPTPEQPIVAVTPKMATATGVLTPTSGVTPTKKPAPTPTSEPIHVIPATDTRNKVFQNVCPAGDTITWAGPWNIAQQSYWAGLVWPEGEPEACLALFQITDTEIIPIASENIEAGYSTRYDEYSAPSLNPQAILIPNQLPFVVTAAQSTGSNGGGGDLLSVWRPNGNKFDRVLSFTLESYTDLNVAIESPCDLDAFTFVQQDDEVRVTPCFDGDTQPTQVYQFDGERFHLTGSRPDASR